MNPSSRFQYKFLKFSTHNDAEKALNDWSAKGWQFISYQAAGDSSIITHFLVIGKDETPERTIGFR